MKLLIVDDHAGVRALIREIAAPIASCVRECECGEAAIALAREFLPDLVTMDARMPGLSGLEACRVISQSHPATRVVVVSAYNLPAVRAAALEAGATTFIPKDNLEDLRPIFARFPADASHLESDLPPSASQRTKD